MQSYKRQLLIASNSLDKNMRGSRGVDRGVQTPLKITKNIGFLSNTGPDPLKNHQAINPALKIGPSSARQ